MKPKGAGRMAGVASRRSTSSRPFRDVAANPALRRVALAFAGFVVADKAVFIALLLVAYEEGGATASALVGLSQLVPAAVAAPFAALLVDRYRRDRVLVAGYLTQAGALAAVVAVLTADASVFAVYALAALAAVATTVARPAQTALLPELARTPAELTAATVAIGGIESVGSFAGPAVAGVLLGVFGAGGVFAGTAGLAFAAALLAGGASARSTREATAGAGGTSGIIADLRDGIGTTVGEPPPRAVTGVLTALALLRGANDVLIVVIAFRLLETGSGGAAFLSSAYGVGALLGVLGTALLVGRRRLSPVALGGALCWTVALVGVGVEPHRAGAPILLGLAGAGRPLIEVTGRLLLLRGVPDRVLGRVFGVLEGLTLAGRAAGLLLAPAVVAALDARAALVLFGFVLPAVVGLGWRRLAEIDAAATVPQAELRLLRGVPIFAPLPAPTLERLAGRLVPVAAPAGTEVIREGDVGDRFYVIAAGEVEVTVGGRWVDAHGPGGFVGEIALLRDVPRTATVTARTDARLLALERDDFLAAVVGHASAQAEADAVVRARLDDRLARERAAAQRGGTGPSKR